MALDPLATTADLTARGITFDAAEQDLVDAALASASATIRAAAGCPISQVTSTITLPGTSDPMLVLPGSPVTAVSAVSLDGDAVDDWRKVGNALWRRCGWTGTCEPAEVTVTYTHGLAEVPADIVDLCCRMAAATLADARAEDDGTGLALRDVVSERIGEYSVSYDQSGRLMQYELSRSLRASLRARFGGGAGMVRFG